LKKKVHRDMAQYSPISDNGPSDGNVFALFEAAAIAHSERPFLVVDTKPLLSYADMLTQTGLAAAWLRSVGVGVGDQIMVQAHKSPASVVLYLACLRAGAVFIPLNTAYQESELAYFLSDAEPSLLVASPGLPGENAPFSGARAVISGNLKTAPWAQMPDLLQTTQSQPDDPAAILYTSGTTGRSKGAVLTHGNLSSNAMVLGKAWHWQDNDVLLHALPIFHAHGLFVALHCALLHASPILFHERFDADAVLRDIPSATVFMGVPTFYTRLLAEPTFDKTRCAGIRLFVSGSAPLLDATFEEFEQRTGHFILERYGMTEALMVTSNPYEGLRIAGSVGPALPGITVRVVAENGVLAKTGEPGVLEMKGPNMFSGYWRNPEKTAEDHTSDGYFISGDIATEDEAGYIRIVGRAKDLIISGGYNVYPKEVEMVIDAIEGVAESAVIGVPHPDFGEGVVAIVARDPGARITADDVAAVVKAEIAAFKRPKTAIIVDELPRNAMGKVQKAELRKLHQDLFVPASA
jgi:malonyl-CoA/methylmalonyl-CoA synthetase